ncbi:MAG: exosortase/archaeosortase family protein [Bacteroidetes bacterium]|nr:exosortase/archaeosortase family protein [Bacteroidota bacterium]
MSRRINTETLKKTICNYSRNKDLYDFLLRMAMLVVAGIIILMWLKSIPGLQMKIVNSTPVYYYSKTFISLCHDLIGWFGYDSSASYIRMPNMEYVANLCTPANECLYLAWPCFGVKITGVFIALIVVFPGKALHKLWFISAGVILIQIFNVLRFSGLVMIVFHYPIAVISNFNLFNLGIGYHEIFNMVLYLVIFGLFFLWINVFGLPRRKMKL